ncbi:putative ABC transport system ATP-binding protein [Loktanella fryxellensis]|uniref:Putative ABC transport system ATP-binding protein n=1 Tax=Loktanella fryxellensis TaxID=245187 RepID=A0A1H7ZLD5_9RHOB|nr:ABC transporter ATP-binding protein [Loktanella fryxellensis]SEM59073.1 putative ABC transport system ATP-binding protein [Loktanella fryxellensis]
MLDLCDVTVTFRDAARSRFTVLDLDHLTAQAGALVVLTGSSGSGKTTLMHALSGLLPVDRGHIVWNGTDIAALSEGARDRWRRDHVGLMFQDFHLIEELSPLDNVLVPAWFTRFRAGPLRARAAALLADFGVPADRRRLSDLSRGERQRTAFARALLFDPQVLLADEPTASLDAQAGALVIDRLQRLARDDGRFVLVVSHDPAVIAAADRVLHLSRGHIAQAAQAA